MTISIRPFEAKDQEQVVRLINAIMDEEFQHERTAYPVDDIQEVKGAYGGRGEAFFVAANGEGVVGTAGIKKEDPRTALLRRLFVARKSRNQKIGQKLLKAVLDFCSQSGYEEVIFKATSRMQAAIGLLQREGFSARAHVKLGAVELIKLTLHLPADAKKFKA